MKSLKLILLGLLLSISSIAFADPITPVGSWVQVGDHSGRPESVVKIWQKNHKLYGKVVKAFVVDGKQPERLCSHCKGELYNKPIIGMHILWGFEKNSPIKWMDGKILDPHSGKIYSCQLTLTHDGNALKVRGYIGFSWLGRTQVWHREGTI